MQASDFGLARRLFPKATDVVSEAFGGALPSLQVPATAVTSSEDGSFLAVVEADFIADEDAIEDEDIDVPDGYSLIEVPSSANVNAGDSVLLTLQGNKALDAGSAGWGDRVNSVAAAAETLAQQAQQVAASAQQGATEAASLAAAASTAASSAQSTADGVAATIPTLATKDELATIASDTGTTVITTPAATAPLVSLDVDGKSVQDGTPTPSDPVAIESVAGANLFDQSGVTGGIRQGTSNPNYCYWSDGVLTNVRSIGAHSYWAFDYPMESPVGAGGTLFISFDVKLSGTHATQQVRVMLLASDSSTGFTDNNYIEVAQKDTWEHFAVVRTVAAGSSAGDTCYLLIEAGNSGNSVQVRNVCLSASNIGYVPYGSIAARAEGGNYIDIERDLLTAYYINTAGKKSVDSTGLVSSVNTSSDGRTFAYARSDFFLKLPAGSYMLTWFVENASTSSSCRIDIRNSANTYLIGKSGANTFSTGDSLPFTLSEQTDVGIIVKMYSATARFMLTRGEDVPTEYEPYQGSTTPIDLQGHELRSLPDGTKDEVSIDSSGNVTLIQRVGYAGADRIAANMGNLVALTDYVRCPSSALMDAPSPSENGVGYCNVAPFQASYAGNHLHVYTHNNTVYLFAPKADKATWTTATAAEWVSEHGVEVIYPLATPQTISLGTITMPTVEDGDTVEIVGSSVVPTIWAEWLTPMGGNAATAADAALAPAIAQVQAMAEETQAYFWADTGGAHVSTASGKAHEAGAGYNMTLGATGTTTGILLDHDAETLASFTPSALNFYADGQVAGSYTKDGVGLFAQDENDTSQQVAAFTASGVTFFDGTGNDAENILATFGASGAQIGNIDETLGHSADQYKMLLDSSGLHIVFQGTQDVVVYDEPTEITSLGVGVLDLLGLHLESYNGGSSSNYSTIRSGNKELYISTGSGYADRGIYIGDFDPIAAKHPVTIYGNTGVNGSLYLPNAKEIFGTPTSGTPQQVLGLNANDQVIINYGGYANENVDTIVEGNDVTLFAKGAINLRKGSLIVDSTPTDWAYLVGSASGSHVRYCKRAGVVFVEVWYESGAAVGTTAKTLGTLPAGFRPSLQVETCAFGNVNNLAMLRVNPGGSIVGKSMSGTMNYFKGTISFPV